MRLPKKRFILCRIRIHDEVIKWKNNNKYLYYYKLKGLCFTCISCQTNETRMAGNTSCQTIMEETWNGGMDLCSRLQSTKWCRFANCSGIKRWFDFYFFVLYLSKRDALQSNDIVSAIVLTADVHTTIGDLFAWNGGALRNQCGENWYRGLTIQWFRFVFIF